MKYLLLVMALLLNLYAIDWPSDYNKALLEAKKEKKDIYLFLGSEYCRYCEKFKKEVLSQDEVIEKLKKSYVLIYLSRDIDDIPSHLETKPVPRHYFLTKEGKVIYTTIGGRSTEGFYELLDEVKDAKEF
ncbi:MAG: thioredoxin family protein [Sulfurimonas sp.]|nr:MAG: thioredoxin family protein [Sulfurimonas sp.]